MLHIKHFTHTDLDGLGAAVVSTHFFKGTGKVVFTPCSYGFINTKVKEFLEYDYDNYDLVFITDISVDDEVAELLQAKYKENRNIQLIDHHETALGLNKYDWAMVKVEESEGKLASGTSLFNAHLRDEYFNPQLISAGIINPNADTENLDDFSEQVRLYDTWEWDKKGLEVPRQLNDMLGLYGFGRFVERFGNDPEVVFNGVERDLIKRIERNRFVYIKNKSSQAKTLQLSLIDIASPVIDEITPEIEEALQTFGDTLDESNPTLTYKLVTNEQYHSELGNAIAKEDGVDAVIMFDLNRGTMSFRTERDDVRVNQLAKICGGGGHAKAAGSPISKDLLTRYMDIYMAELDK